MGSLRRYRLIDPSGHHPQGEVNCMTYVYAIISKKKKWIYVGCTDNLRRRFKEHNTGLVSSTKAHRPFVLLYYEAYTDNTDARVREYKIKNHSQTRELLYKQIEQSIMALSSNG